MKKILLSLFLAAVSLSSYAQHFITDPNFRQKVENAFQAKMKVIGKKFYNTKGLRVSPEKRRHYVSCMLICLLPMQQTIQQPITLKHTHRFANKKVDGMGKGCPRIAFQTFRSANACEQ